MTRSHSCLVAVLVCLAASGAFAQGQQYGTASGRVSSADGQPLPGVSVTVSSAALQGTRTGTTDINGVYSLPDLRQEIRRSRSNSRHDSRGAANRGVARHGNGARSAVGGCAGRPNRWRCEAALHQRSPRVAR